MGLIKKQNIYILAILYQDFTFLPWANYKQTCKKTGILSSTCTAIIPPAFRDGTIN